MAPQAKGRQSLTSTCSIYYHYFDLPLPEQSYTARRMPGRWRKPSLSLPKGPATVAVDATELAPGVQLRTPAQLIGLQDAAGVRGITGLWRSGKQTALPTSPQPRLRRRRAILVFKPKPGNSSYGRMRKTGQANSGTRDAGNVTSTFPAEAPFPQPPRCDPRVDHFAGSVIVSVWFSISPLVRTCLRPDGQSTSIRSIFVASPRPK